MAPYGTARKTAPRSQRTRGVPAARRSCEAWPRQATAARGGSGTHPSPEGAAPVHGHAAVSSCRGGGIDLAHGVMRLMPWFASVGAVARRYWPARTPRRERGHAQFAPAGAALRRPRSAGPRTDRHIAIETVPGLQQRGFGAGARALCSKARAARGRRLRRRGRSVVHRLCLRWFVLNGAFFSQGWLHGTSVPLMPALSTPPPGLL